MAQGFQIASVLAVLLAAAACSGRDETAWDAEASAPVPVVEEIVVENAFGEGQAIAETLCAGCHAVGAEGDSPHGEARPFRLISHAYPVSDLEESFAEGIVVGHPDMPMWQFEPHQIEALLGYIESVQAPAAAQP